ncbi:MAG TPA: hypothetical protein VKB51_12730 [bacterium]|nr:hypothetical protein [bacterium]
MSDQDPRQEEQQHEQQSGPGPGWGRENLTDLYEKMSGIFRDSLERAGTFSEEAFERALRESREWASKFRENYAEDISRVAEFIRRDWHAAIRFTQEQYRRNFDLDRLQAGAMGVLSRLAQSAGAQLETFAGKINDRLTYKTGEIAGAGSLQCTKCEQVLSFDKATRIPPCPKCHGTQFRRSF